MQEITANELKALIIKLWKSEKTLKSGEIEISNMKIYGNFKSLPFSKMLKKDRWITFRNCNFKNNFRMETPKESVVLMFYDCYFSGGIEFKSYNLQRGMGFHMTRCVCEAGMFSVGGCVDSFKLHDVSIPRINFFRYHKNRKEMNFSFAGLHYNSFSLQGVLDGPVSFRECDIDAAQMVRLLVPDAKIESIVSNENLPFTKF